MAFKVDPKKVAAKAAEEAKKAAARGGPRKLFWKPRPGKNGIRIMPAWTDEGPNALQFWREVHIHWGIGVDEENQQHFTCPKLTPPGGGECPICQEYERLKSSQDPSEKEAARELRPRARAYSNIIDLDDPVWAAADVQELKSQGAEGENLPKVGDPKIQIFSYGPRIMKELLDLFCDSPEICDLDKGHNIYITREGTGLQTEYRVRPDLKKTAAPCKGEPKLHDLDNVMPPKEPAEMMAILQGIEVEEARQLRGEDASQLPASEPEDEPTSESNEVGDVADAVGEDPEVEASPDEEAAVEHPWMDEDGNFVIPEGHNDCFGFERDINDDVCNTQCDAFMECREAVIFRCKLEGVDPPKNSLEPEKKKKQPSKKPSKKPSKAVASGNSSGAKAVEDLESRMKAAIASR